MNFIAQKRLAPWHPIYWPGTEVGKLTSINNVRDIFYPFFGVGCVGIWFSPNRTFLWYIYLSDGLISKDSGVKAECTLAESSPEAEAVALRAQVSGWKGHQTRGLPLILLLATNWMQWQWGSFSWRWRHNFCFKIPLFGYETLIVFRPTRTIHFRVLLHAKSGIKMVFKVS